MTYIAAADFREQTLKGYCANLVLGEADGTDAYVDLVIAHVTTRVEIDLIDDFEPTGGDPDEAVDVTAYGTYTLYLPRRCRSITTLKTRDSYGNLTTQASAGYRLRSSLNAAGTAMVESRSLDWLEALPGLTTGCWPSATSSVQITGKFGWAAVPEDIKRLVALLVYDQIKATADPLSTMTQLNTVDGIRTYGPSAEVTDIMARYRRDGVLVA